MLKTAQARIKLTIAGTPKATPRLRSRVIVPKNGGKPFAHHYTPKVADAWKGAVKAALRAESPADTPWAGPVSISMGFYFERPQRLCRKKDPEGRITCTAKPDVDNLVKAAMDALTDAGLWNDDAQVCRCRVDKWYAAKGCGPGVVIVAEHLDGFELEVLDDEADEWAAHA